MWGQMKAWLKDGGAYPKDQAMYQDIIGPETVPRLDGKIQLESKKDMKKRGIPSPGRGDACALSFAFPVGPADRLSGTRGGAGYDQSEEWSPFDYL